MVLLLVYGMSRALGTFLCLSELFLSTINLPGSPSKYSCYTSTHDGAYSGKQLGLILASFLQNCRRLSEPPKSKCYADIMFDLSFYYHYELLISWPEMYSDRHSILKLHHGFYNCRVWTYLSLNSRPVHFLPTSYLSNAYPSTNTHRVSLTWPCCIPIGPGSRITSTL